MEQVISLFHRGSMCITLSLGARYPEPVESDLEGFTSTHRPVSLSMSKPSVSDSRPGSTHDEPDKGHMFVG
jgi:hypothetical protein